MEPDKLSYDNKLIWLYDDIFPKNQPYKLISTFCHHDYNIKMHSHDFYELNFIVSGHGFHYTEATKMCTKKGDIFVIPPGCFHGYYSEDNLNVFHMLIHKNFFSRYYSELNMMSTFSVLFRNYLSPKKQKMEIVYFNADDKLYDELLSIFNTMEKLNQELEVKKYNFETENYLFTYTYANLIIIKICSAYKSNYSNNNYKKKDETDILNVINYIHLNYQYRITLNDLCEHSFYSKTLLSEKFNDIMGFSPMGYVNYYRTLMAKKMLIETNKNISEISDTCGFYDTSHFTKIFKKYQLISPSDIRKK